MEGGKVAVDSVPLWQIGAVTVMVVDLVRVMGSTSVVPGGGGT